MVKFGRHQRCCVQQCHSYVVPYNDAKTRIEEDHIASHAFATEWKAYLAQARAAFDTTLTEVWRTVFDALVAAAHENGDDTARCEEVRGVPPENALLLFAQQVNCTGQHACGVLDQFKNLHATASLNAEALRKLVKKFDKHIESCCDINQQTKSSLLSAKLLPELYAANFVIGLTSLQQAIDLLRSEMGLGDYVHAQPPPECSRQPGSPNAASKPVIPELEPAPCAASSVLDDNSDHASPNSFTMLSTRRDSHVEHLHLVDKRRQELQWLHGCVQRISDLGYLPHLVAHRGFHSPNDRSDKRPMENSLQAYELSWSSGIHLCECDIALTKDERLILAHDEDFSRLALLQGSETAHRNVRELTLREIMSVALQSGVRPPLLLDVLESAHAIGGQSQLVIEIKPGNREAASALARLFGQHPYLMAKCAVIMSFDSFVMHALQEELDAWFGASTSSSTDDPQEDTVSPGGGIRRRYSVGITFPSSMDLAQQQQPTNNKYPRPKLLLLTVCDDPKREVELQVSMTEEEEAVQKIDGWLKGRLDGVYLQFEPHMCTPQGLIVLQTLARQYRVGVWGHNGRDPDDYGTFSKLVQKGGASFVNTDLPRNFFL